MHEKQSAPLAAPDCRPEDKTRGDESFPVAWIVRRPLRPAVLAFYAFARHADNIADHPTLSAEHKLLRLEAMRHTLKPQGQGRPHRGAPSVPLPSATSDDVQIAQTLKYHLNEQGLSPYTAVALLDAFSFDARRPARIESLADLEAYCRLSAQPVGRFLLALHRERPCDALYQASDSLCSALQILNHLQDLADDWRGMGRCYLPLDWLDEAGGHPEMLAADGAPPAVWTVIQRLRDYAGDLLVLAAPLPALIRDRRLAAQAAATLSTGRSLHAILAVADPLIQEPHLSKGHWARAAMSSLATLLRPPVRRKPKGTL